VFLGYGSVLYVFSISFSKIKIEEKRESYDDEPGADTFYQRISFFLESRG
jgi:hypothetical protein